MTQPVYPPADAQIALRRKEVARGIHHAFSSSAARCSPVVPWTRRPSSSSPWQSLTSPSARTASTAALLKGASEHELMEAIGVAAEMRSCAHSILALETAGHHHGPRAA